MRIHRAYVMLACLATACGGVTPPHPEEQPRVSPAPPLPSRPRAILQLGQRICGDCCVERVRQAFANKAGVGRITMHPGDLDFVVEYSPSQTSPEAMVEILAAAGEKGARVSPNNQRAQPNKKWVVAR